LQFRQTAMRDREARAIPRQAAAVAVVVEGLEVLDTAIRTRWVWVLAAYERVG
jgi:hypothetical protein